jgi:hypothetical protein
MYILIGNRQNKKSYGHSHLNTKNIKTWFTHLAVRSHRIRIRKDMYIQLIQSTFLTADFPAIFGVLPLPRLRVSAPQNTTFSIVVVCIMVN